MSLHFRHLLSYVIENTSAVIWFITRGARLCILLNALSNPAFVLSNGVRLLIKTLRVWAGAWKRAGLPGGRGDPSGLDLRKPVPLSENKRLSPAQPMPCGDGVNAMRAVHGSGLG